MRRFLPLVFMVLSLIVLEGREVRADEKPAAKDNLKALLEDRLDTTKKIQEIALKMYAQGSGSYTQVHEAQVAVLEARLDLCVSKEERLKVLELMLTQAKEWEKVVAARHAAGLASPLEPLNAKAYRLEREIALERFKADK